MSAAQQHCVECFAKSKQIWKSLSVTGLPTECLDYVHGFVAAPEVSAPLNSVIEISGLQSLKPIDRSADTSPLRLKTEFVSATLSSGASAEVLLLRNLPAGDPKALLPLTAALTQQWLLAGFLSMHAAVVTLKRGTLLVLGNSHAGKSTLVRAALAIGARVVTDDLVRIAATETTAETASKINASSLRGFVRFRGDHQASDETILIRSGDARFLEQATIDGMVFLQSETAGNPRAAQTRVGAISELEASAQLINQSAPLFLQGSFPIERQLLLRFIQRLLAKLPRVQALTGRDVHTAPEQAFQTLTDALGLSGVPLDRRDLSAVSPDRRDLSAVSPDRRDL
jgi:hypothetical protein